MKIWWIVLLGLAVLAAAAWPWAASTADRVAGWIRPPDSDPVPTIRVAPQPYVLAVRAVGELSGFQTIPLMTPMVRRGSLKIAWLAKEGQIVRQGDTVVEFDPAPARLTLQQSENQFESLGFQLEKTQENTTGQLEVLRLDQTAADQELAFAESQIRMDEDIFSRWEIQESLMSAALAQYRRMTLEQKAGLQQTLAGSDLKMLEIDRHKTRTEMGLAQETLAAMRLTAPASGVLLYARQGLNQLEVGTEVWPGQPLMGIAGLDKFRAIVRIPEKDSTGIKQGQLAEVQLQALPGIRLPGTVTGVARVARQVQREDPRKYFETEVLLDVPVEWVEQLKPGMKVETEVELERLDSALVVPRSSVIKKNGGWVVYAAASEGYREVPVTIRAGDHGFYLVEGLNEGMVICLRHPYEQQRLVLPDFNLPAGTTQERFVIYW